MPRGRLLILNGGSSAGKTSLAQALQDILPEPHFLLGIDLFWFSLPTRQLDLERVEPQYYRTEDEVIDGKEYFRIVPGPLLDAAMAARYRAIRAYLDYGLNVIADDVIWKREWLNDTVRLLEGYDVLFIGVHVSDAEGARREIARGNRHGGWNRGSAEAAHRNAGGIYDLEIDTSNDSPAVCAQRIKAALAAGLQGTAFAKLRAASELVDVIDDAGNVVGTATRREMRARRLPHRCTYILVFNRAGQLFIHQRTATKDVFPSHWDVAVGGVLAAGEMFDVGAERELLEELGVTAPLERLFPFRYADAATVVDAMVYRAVHDGPFRLQPEEVVAGEFVSVADAQARAATRPFCPDGLAVLEAYGRSGSHE